MSVKQSLLDMGFIPDKIDKAITACGENVEQAMEWLLVHADESESSEVLGNKSESEKPQTAAVTPPESEAAQSKDETEAAQNKDGTEASESNTNQDASAKSLKCDECGKLFKNSEEVEYHAVKSGHASFSESTEEKKALTEEEKKEKLRVLEEKLRQRRIEKEEEDRRDVVEREKKRIQMGRNIAETKQRMQDKEILRMAEERRREKQEDKLARQKVKDQIERDKVARKEMFAAPNSSKAAVQSPVSPVAPTAPVVPKKDYENTRLQIRLPSGSPLVHEFKSKEALSAVRLWIELNRPDRDSSGLSFRLSTTFPRKVFGDEDLDKPLDVLGLVPSAVLVIMDN